MKSSWKQQRQASKYKETPEIKIAKLKRKLNKQILKNARKGLEALADFMMRFGQSASKLSTNIKWWREEINDRQNQN